MQPKAKPSFEWPELTAEPERKLAPLPTSPAQPQLAEPVTATKRGWLLPVFASGALAYLVLNADLGTVLVIAAVLGVLLSLAVAWGIWVTNNIHY